MNTEVRISVRVAAERLYPIGAAARLTGMHPQTLRQYDRLGLVRPSRTAGRGRRYSREDLAKLREVQRLSAEEGINLAGIRRILALEAQVKELTAQVEKLKVTAQLARRVFAVTPDGGATALVQGQRFRRAAASNSTALVVWRPQ